MNIYNITGNDANSFFKGIAIGFATNILAGGIVLVWSVLSNNFIYLDAFIIAGTFSNLTMIPLFWYIASTRETKKVIS